MTGSRLRQTGTILPHSCIIDAYVTLAHRETWFCEGGGARPKGGASSGAQVWTLSAALAKPIRVTLPRRPWRARCPPGCHFVREHRRESSDTPRCALGGGREGRRSQRLARGHQKRRWGGDRATGDGPWRAPRSVLPPRPLQRCWRGLQSCSRHSEGVTRDCRRSTGRTRTEWLMDGSLGWDGRTRPA